MGQVTSSVDIAAAPDKVWSALTELSNFENWLTIHTKWKGDLPAEIGKGTQYTEVVTMLGMPNTITWTVDDYDAPNKLTISGTGMAGVKVRFTLSVEPSGEGATASIVTDFQGQMIVGALGKAVEKDGKANLDESLAKLAALVG